MPPVSDDDLRKDGREYVHSRLNEAGGFAEACRGLQHKTLPVLLGLPASLTVTRVVAMLLRITLLTLAAISPVLIRKAFFVQSSGGIAPNADLATLVDTMHLDKLDYLLACLALLGALGPRFLEAVDRHRRAPKRLPYYDLAAAIDKMPALDRNGRGRDGASEAAITDAINCALLALRDEMAELVDESGRTKIADVTLFEFCDPQGARMQVRGRTARSDPNLRPVPSARLMAYQVAVTGKPFIEHDFLNRHNPYPKSRVTVPNSPKVRYRSILYLPIIWSRFDHDATADATSGAVANREVIDSVIGIVCVDCTKPYRFWRWGDHSRPGGAFESVAFERALPYIALLTKLLEPTAPKVPLEVS